MGAYSSEIEAPGENKPICTLEKSKVARSSTTSVLRPKLTFLPAERSLASAYTFPTGNLRSARISSITSPTAPVAPTTATSYVF